MVIHQMLGIASWNPCVTDIIHLANVLYLLSYLVRDILWLRVLSVMAGLCLMPYYCHCGEHPLWAPISWNALFTAVNVFQIVVLVGERWPRTLRGPEKKLYEKVFPELKPGEFVKLLCMSERMEVAAGTMLVEQGADVQDMLLLTEGELEVRVNGDSVVSIQPGQFIGEMSFITGDKASADVVAVVPSVVVRCSQESLKRLLENKPGMAIKIQAALGRDVVAKLRNQSGRVNDPERH